MPHAKPADTCRQVWDTYQPIADSPSLFSSQPKCPVKFPLLLCAGRQAEEQRGFDSSMKVPIGFIAKLWSFMSFVPFFLILLLLGLIKAAIIGPVVAIMVFAGNSAVIIGLWPAHFFWTYHCVVMTKRLGPVLKPLVLLCLPVPLLVWPLVGILGSILIGLGYGYFVPLMATFEAVGEEVIDKLYHCFIDGCKSTIQGACTLVRDFTDICFHSYFSFMDGLSKKVPDDEAALDVEITRLPSCLLVSLLGVPTDVLAISLVALLKSPYMLLRGWQRLLHDLIGREGPFLETVCVPFAGLAIMLWPLAVVGAVITAVICSFFLGLYGGVIVYEENSVLMGFFYIVSIVSLFDEYTNDLLYLREGSCLPRPKYRKYQAGHAEKIERAKHGEEELYEDKMSGSKSMMLESNRSMTLKKAIHQLKPIQIWDWLFRSCELNGRCLLSDGLISISDIEECVSQGNCKKLSISLPAWCILQCLLRSAKVDANGLLISDGVELTNFNWPKDKLVEWLFGPLVILKQQIKGLHLDECEESCLRDLIMTFKNERPEDWDGSGFPSDDNVRRAQVQAILRRLQGIVASLSRLPTFRRRFNALVKSLYLDSVEGGKVSSNESKAVEERRKQANNIGRESSAASLADIV